MSQPSLESSPLFDYNALVGAQSIRLLQIDQSSHSSSTISCLLTEHNIDDQPPTYAALSYVWGDSESTIPILINNCRTIVTINLHNALAQIRASFPYPLLWIDAICIDQKNPQERNQQVAMMRKIYSRATHTIAWLQPRADVECLFEYVQKHQIECKGSKRFLEGRAKSVSPPRSIHSQRSLRRLRSSRRLETNNHVPSDKSLRPTYPPVAYKPSTSSLRNEFERPSSHYGSQHQTCSLDADQINAVREIEDQPYWDRVWIIQEIVVARKVLLMCDSRTLDWQSFIDFLRLLSNDHFAVPQLDLQHGINRSHASSHRSFILRLSRWPRIMDLGQALHWSSTSQASDVRDKVYALLGLVNSGAGTSLIADYGIAPCVVFCLALRAMVRDWHRLLSGYPTFKLDYITFYRGKIRTEVKRISHPCADIAFHYLENARPAIAYDSPFSRFSHCDGRECGSLDVMQVAAHWNKPVFDASASDDVRLRNMQKLASDLPDHAFWDKSGAFYHISATSQPTHSHMNSDSPIAIVGDRGRSQERLESPNNHVQGLQPLEEDPPARAPSAAPQLANCSVCLSNSYMRARLLRKGRVGHNEATCGACGRSWLSDLQPNRLLDISEGGFRSPPISWDNLVPCLPTECPKCQTHHLKSKIRFATFDEPTHLECSGCREKWYYFEDVFDVMNFQGRIVHNSTKD